MKSKNINPGQLRVQTAFKIAVAYLSPLQGIIKKGFREKALRKKSTATGLALGHALRVAIVYKGSTPKINPSAILLSEGALAPINLLEAVRYEESLEVKYHCAKFTAGDDLVTLCIYDDVTGRVAVNIIPSKRKDEIVKVELPIEMRGQELHVYVIVSDRTEKKFARSQYIGRSLPHNIWEDNQYEQ